MSMKYVQLYFSYLDPLADLSDEQLGRVVRALMQYGSEGTLPSFTGLESMAWKFLRSNFDRDVAAYEQKVEQWRENGRKGGAPKGNRNAQKEKNNQKQPSGSKTTQEEEKEKEDEEKESSSNKEEVVFPAAAGTMTTFPPLLNDMLKSLGATPYVYKQAAADVEALGEQLVVKVVSNCMDNGARNWSYVRKALESVKAEGITTAAEYEARHQRSKANVVDREQPSGNDYLRGRGRRPLKLKQE